MTHVPDPETFTDAKLIEAVWLAVAERDVGAAVEEMVGRYAQLMKDVATSRAALIDAREAVREAERSLLGWE